MSEMSNKLYGTALRRTEIEKVWRGLYEGKFLNLKIKNRKDQRTGELDVKIEKCKVIKKQHRSVLVQLLRNGIKETFVFGDFMTGDVAI